MAEVIVTVTGNVGAEPTLNTGPSGVLWTHFSVASTRRVRDAEGRWSDGDTTWYKVRVYRDQARNVVESLHRGTPVIVTGRLTVEDYQISRKVMAANGTEVEVMETRRTLAIDNPTIGIDLRRGTATYIKRVHDVEEWGAATPAQGIARVAAAVSEIDSNTCDDVGVEPNDEG